MGANVLSRSMCDFPEEELEEWLAWLEAARVRSEGPVRSGVLRERFAPLRPVEAPAAEA